MKRRDALRGIIGITTVGLISYKGLNFVYRNNLEKVNDIREYSDLIADLAEVIIPTTSTLGAKNAEVHYYIISYMENCARRKEYVNFINGLMDIEEMSTRKYNHSFSNCNTNEKYGIVKELDDDSKFELLQKISNKIRGRSFFNLLKSLTIEGYCTSEIGATKFLKYEPIPGHYQPITSFINGQKAWATK